MSEQRCGATIKTYEANYSDVESDKTECGGVSDQKESQKRGAAAGVALPIRPVTNRDGQKEWRQTENTALQQTLRYFGKRDSAQHNSGCVTCNFCNCIKH